MTDRIVLSAMRFEGRHGLTAEERAEPRPFEVDVEMVADLQPAGQEDDLARTVDYAQVFAVCRDVVESTHFKLIEAIAEAIAHEILVGFGVTEVLVRVRKLDVPVDGRLAWAGVEIRRSRGERR